MENENDFEGLEDLYKPEKKEETPSNVIEMPQRRPRRKAVLDEVTKALMGIVVATDEEETSAAIKRLNRVTENLDEEDLKELLQRPKGPSVEEYAQLMTSLYKAGRIAWKVIQTISKTV